MEDDDDEDDDEDDENNSIPEDNITFVECTCEHEPNEHGWMNCEVEECDCNGHWEE
jgi:hypothetical protein